MKLTKQKGLVMIVSIIIAVAFVMVSFSSVGDNTSQVQQNNSLTFNPAAQGLVASNYSDSITNNGHNSITNIWANYTVNTKLLKMNMGNNTTIVSQFGLVQVNVTGSTLSLFISINNSENAQVVNTSVADSMIPNLDPPNFQIYYKFPTHFSAALVVMTVGVSSLSVYTIAGVVADFGEVGAVEGGYIEAFNAELTPLIPVIIAGIAVDFADLYGYALVNDYPTIYIDIGGSVGNQWYNFFDVGAYGEEGVFTGAYDQQDNGTYLPILTTGGSSSYDPHTDVWNPNAQPPW